MKRHAVLLLLFVSLAPGLGGIAPPTSPADLFGGTNIWTIHLRFTPEQFTAMEPQGGRGMFGGPGGPGGPGGRPGGGPAMFLAPAFLKGDQDRDGKLSKDEFRQLGETWFAAWDKEKANQLTAAQLRAGLEQTFQPPGFGPPGGGGPPLQGAAGRRNGMAAAAGLNFKYVHADLEFEGATYKDIAVRYKGNNTFMESRNSLKRSLKLDLNKYVKGQKLVGLSQLNLHNNVTDPSWMNEVLSYRLFREAGVPAPRTAYARVFVTVPGQFDRTYFGLYSVVEDIDNNFAAERFGTRKGAIFKPVTRALFSYLGEDWANYAQTYDPKTDLSGQEKRRVIEFAKLVSEGSDSAFAGQLSDFLDLDEFARFMAVTVWLVNLDSLLEMGQNFYVYLQPDTGRFQFLPWDLDHSFGQFPMGGSQEQREQLSLDRPWRGENRFLERVFKVESFRKLYRSRLTELSQTLCRPERFHQQVNALAAAIRPAVQEESETKLARFERVVAGQAVEPTGFGGPPGSPPGAGQAGGEMTRRGPGPGPGFRAGVKPIKPFVTARAEAVLAQLAGKTDGLAPGGPNSRGGRGGPPGPDGFGPAAFLERAFLEALDTNKDGVITTSEFNAGFTRWFANWNSDGSGALTPEQLRAGLNRDLAPFRGGPPGGMPFGPPDGPPPF